VGTPLLRADAVTSPSVFPHPAAQADVEDSDSAWGAFPFRSFPSGWFQMAWSAEIPVGGIKPLRYFGQDLVLYRGESGIVHVLDGLCGHRGAHLAYGGEVRGDDLICPNHGWRWDCLGVSCGKAGTARDPEPNSNRRIRKWPVREWSELVYVWHDEAGAAPHWEPPRFDVADDEGYYPAYPEGVAQQVVTFPAHYLVENMADLPHIRFVHRWIDVPVLENWIETGPCLHTEIRGRIPTPDGEQEMLLDNEAWGMGLVIAKMDGLRSTVELIALTPIDREFCEIRISWWVRKGKTEEPDGLAKAIYRAQTREVLDPAAADRLIWDNLRYVANPPLAREEAKCIASYRKWIKQFYPS
jgi:3-ketosteroid 9alpha-monooxygenase subunit A